MRGAVVDKAAVKEALVELLNPIQGKPPLVVSPWQQNTNFWYFEAAYEASKEWQEIALKAYPPPEKKQKKVTDPDPRPPGAAQGAKAAASPDQDLASRMEQAQV